MIAELIRPKGVEVFIRAIPTIVDELPSTKFIVAGDGPERPMLEKLARELCISDRVRFLGWVSNSKRVIKDMDVFVFPSLLNYDGLPRVLLEAWAVGTPVVATEVAAVPELFRPNIDGILVNPGAPQEIATGVLELLLNQEKATRIARSAWQKVKSFDVNREIETMESTYIELLEKTRHQPINSYV